MGRVKERNWDWSFFVHITTLTDLLCHLCCSPRAVSGLTSLNGETVAAGVVTCLIVYPLYLLVFTLFRMSRSKVLQTCHTVTVLSVYQGQTWSPIFLCVCVHQCVSVEQVPPQVDQESVEIDDFLDNSMAGSSFLFFTGEVDSDDPRFETIMADIIEELHFVQGKRLKND